jgi:hypothetical protein
MNNQNKQEIDVESFTKAGKEIPKGHIYIIIVDRQQFKVEDECMTGRDILLLAGKTPPERFQLNVRYKGGKVAKVGYDETICFTTPGVEKFMTIPLDQTEGGK